MVCPYLIFVIIFTRAQFLENEIYTEKRVNYDKLHSKLPILRVNYDKTHSKLPFFRVTSEKIYTGQKNFTRTPPVAPVTNMRYEQRFELVVAEDYREVSSLFRGEIEEYIAYG